MRNLILSLLLVCAAVPGYAAEADDDLGETLSLQTADNKSFAAYRAGPYGAKHGVLLLHESWGFTSHTRDLADWLGRLGYRVLAVDLYDGKIAQTRAQASAYMAAVNQGSANAKYRAAIAVLKAPGRKLITMGWEFGGTQALQASIAAPGAVSATVVYDAELPTDGNVLRAIRPVLAVVARGGSANANDQARVFETTLKRLKKPVQVHYYRRDSVDADAPRYTDEAMQLVWPATVAFMKKYAK